MSATDSGSNPNTNAPRPLVQRIFVAGIIWPIVTMAVGVDGGDIFQILAIDNLDLDPRALGIALGLGTLSIPIQIWAARIPLERARLNIRLHLWFTGSMSIIVAALIAFAEPGSMLAGLALVIAILAEISVSVLIATSWQPVISYTLSTKQRQFLNGQGRATRGVILLSCVLLFGQLGQTGRAMFMVVLGAVAIAAGVSLHVLPAPKGESVVEDAPADDPGWDSSAAIRNIFITLPAMGLAWWPLMLSYIALVAWPSVNLGLIGAALAFGGIVTSALWRDPGRHLVAVLKVATLAYAACSITVAFLQPETSTWMGLLTLMTLSMGTAARAVVSIGIEELTHRRVDEANSVKVMTMSDVIGSTSFQLGFFIAGFLVAASVGSTTAINPYQVWLIATAILLVATVSRLRDRSMTAS